MNQNPVPHQLQTDSLFKVVRSVILVVIIAYSAFHLYSSPKKDEPPEEAPLEANTTENATVEAKIEPVQRKLVSQPSCPKTYMLDIMVDISRDVHLKKNSCFPGDKKKVKTEDKETEDRTMHLYVVGAFILVSVCIVMDLMEFKGTSKQTKAPLSRKCSLADLTVLKHQRKELVRRESILESPEESSYKQMGYRQPPPLHRRCSFPISTARLNYQFNNTDISFAPVENRRFLGNSRRSSNIYDSQSIIENRRQSILDSRRVSIVSQDSRRVSLVSHDSRRVSLAPYEYGGSSSLDVRRISMDSDSPDRRHHVRFVHRH